MVTSTVSRYVQQLPFRRSDFPEGDEGTSEYFKYFISTMFEGPGGNVITQTTAMVTGQLGAGKTSFLVGFSWWIRDIFGIPVSTDFHLNQGVFGQYEYLGYDDLANEMVHINELANSGASWEENNSPLYKHVVIWDEIYKKVHRRRSMENINILVGDIMKQQRHFQSIFMFAAPDMSDIDPKEVNQYITVDISGVKSRTREGVSIFHLYNRINSTEAYIELYLPHYLPMFNSFSPPTMRQKVTTTDLMKAVKKAYCMNCNKEYDASNKYCGKCQALLVRASFCTNPDCKSLVVPKYKYCPKCGTENDNYRRDS